MRCAGGGGQRTDRRRTTNRQLKTVRSAEQITLIYLPTHTHTYPHSNVWRGVARCVALHTVEIDVFEVFIHQIQQILIDQINRGFGARCRARRGGRRRRSGRCGR